MNVIGSIQCRLSDTEIIDGVKTPAVFDRIETEVFAIRHSIALSQMNYVSIISVKGKDSHAYVDRIIPRNLSLKSHQMKQSVLINERGRYVSDVYVCRNGDEYILLCKGENGDVLVPWLLSFVTKSEDVAIRFCNDTYTLIAVNGPFSWELMADVYGQGISWIPYMSFFQSSEEEIVFRTSDTGEYGYLICIRNDKASALWDDMLSKGIGYDIVCAGNRALEYCMLESNVFNIRKEGRLDATPAELQIQWRFTYDKASLFTEQLQQMRSKPLAGRLTGVFCTEPIAEGAEIFNADDRSTIGKIITAHKFLSGSGYIGLAMITTKFMEYGACIGYVTNNKKKADILAAFAPFVNNRSLFVEPGIHVYAERNRIKFPPLCSNSLWNIGSYSSNSCIGQFVQAFEKPIDSRWDASSSTC